MNRINPVCRPATENEINYGEAKWCAKCTSECDSKGKDELVMCDYFKTNDNDPIVPGCPSLMPHALPGGFDSVAPAEEGTPMNAAKMRDALSDACYAMFNFLKTQNGGYEEMAKALDKAKAALAVPPRNCDRPECATSKAAQDVWRKEDGGKTAYYEWLLAESTKGETK